MILNSATRLAGVPILEVRRLFRCCRCSEWSTDTVATYLKIARPQALRLVAELYARGYVERSSDIDGEASWRRTLDGCSLANASAAKPLHRATADRLFREFLARVRHVNGNRRFLLKVTRVVVFGSYLTGAERLSDIDVAVDLEPKHEDTTVHFARWRRKLSEADRNGIRFANKIERAHWPEIEVRKFLKARSRAISLHDIADGILRTAAVRELSAL